MRERSWLQSSISLVHVLDGTWNEYNPLNVWSWFLSASVGLQNKPQSRTLKKWLHKYSSQTGLNSFTTYLLLGEFSPLTWSAYSVTTIAGIANLTVYKFIHKLLENGRSVTLNVTGSRNTRTIQSSFKAITQTILWPQVTKSTWPRVQKEHQQIKSFELLFTLFPHLL